jgi:hypothetical protein
VFLADEMRHRPAADPELTFVLLMCCYARDVMTGELSGRYSDEKARAYARAALIPGAARAAAGRSDADSSGARGAGR